MATNRKEIVLSTQNQTNLEIKCRALKVCASFSHFIIKWSYSAKHLIKNGFSFPQITVSRKITSGYYGMGGLVSVIRLLLAFCGPVREPCFLRTGAAFAYCEKYLSDNITSGGG